MIKITKLNKYFNKNRSNEIHVLHDINLELPDTGFVTILGASGSGKSTLLNVLGGIDNYDSGNIEYSNITNIKQEVGFIFQNYLLIDHLTVYQNLVQALEIIGIYDKKLQDQRIKYVLSLVNLSNYERKKCMNLSGGEKQRIAIARVLLKQSKLILADEPTGNLDSENTIEVMNILKSLSLHSLVILVTHEQPIAKMYSDRIISIIDGKVVSDELNIDPLIDYEINSNNSIHLLDLEQKNYQNDDFKIDLYTDNSINLNNFRLIIKNKTVYIETPYKTVDVESSKINLLNSSSKDFKKQLDKKISMSIDETIFEETQPSKKHYHSNLKQILGEIFSGNKMSKFLRLVFIFLGAICAYLIISYSKYEYVDDSLLYNLDDVSYIYHEKEYGGYYSQNTSEIIDANNSGKISEIMGTAYKNLIVDYKKNFIQKEYYNFQCYASVLNPDSKVYLGRMPNLGSKECVIGKAIYQKILDKIGLDNDINLSFIYEENSFEVVGVLEDETNLIYYHEFDYFNSALMNSKSLDYIYLYDTAYANYKDVKYQIIKGNDLSNDPTKHEILLDKQYLDNELFDIGDEVTYQITNLDTIEYQVVGFFEITDENSFQYLYLSNDDTLYGTYLYDFVKTIYSQIVGSDYYRDTDKYYYFNKSMYQLSSGKYPTLSNEICAPEHSNIKINDVVSIGSNKYTVVGLFKPFSLNINNTIVPFDEVIIFSKAALFTLNYYGSYYLTFIPNSESFEYFDAKGYVLSTFKEYTYEAQRQEKEQRDIITPIIIAVLASLIIIYSYFTTRSKMIKDIRNIGIKLAVGEKKKTILGYYIKYSIILTLVSSAVGYLIITLGYAFLTIKYPYLFNPKQLKVLYLFIGYIALFGINILTALIPSLNILKNTPARILSKYDI